MNFTDLTNQQDKIDALYMTLKVCLDNIARLERKIEKHKERLVNLEIVVGVDLNTLRAAVLYEQTKTRDQATIVPA